MPTTKDRIHITLNKENKEFLTVLAKRDQVPVATKASEFIREMLEIEEDKIWDELASKRDTKDAVFVSHAEAWKESTK